MSPPPSDDEVLQPEMSSRKRRAGDHSAQRPPKGARPEAMDSPLDQVKVSTIVTIIILLISSQELNSLSDSVEIFGDFKVAIKHTSASKAARHDPIFTGEDDDDKDSDEEFADNESDDDDDESDHDYSQFGSEWKWLEPISVKVTSVADLSESGKARAIAYCQAQLIRRAQMRHEFYEEIEQPSVETSRLGFDLFDRYGRLRSEFKAHPVMKGTGIWGSELDHGDMLLIEVVFVNKEHRRQGLGRKIIESLLRFTRHKTDSFFVFAWPTIVRLGDLSEEWDSLSEDDAARDKMEDREHDRAVMFHKSLGFRRVGSTIWFAMAPNSDHPSQQLAATDDFSPPQTPVTSLHSLLSAFEEIGDPRHSPFEIIINPQPRELPDLLNALHDCMLQLGSTDACWTTKDKDGNTVLHLAASINDVACVEWILDQDFGARLLQLRNNTGETPLESLQFKLEKLRTQKVINLLTLPVSDRFQGHGDRAVRCLVLLKGLRSMASVEQLQGLDALLRIDRGCTCGQCLRGFLSPRMSHALLSQAEIGHDLMNDTIDEYSGPEWIEDEKDSLGYLPSRVRDNLGTNKSMRQGFSNLWRYVATCLSRGRVPTELNVLDVARSVSEWPPATANFLQRGGTVEPVFLAICRGAMAQDEWMGDGMYQETFSEHIASLPECRNDHEFGFVSGMCGYRRISLTRHVDMWGNTVDEDGNMIDSAL